MTAKTQINIKGQGKIPLSQPKKIQVDRSHKPGREAGESRGEGAALRGNKFKGIF